MNKDGFRTLSTSCFGPMGTISWFELEEKTLDVELNIATEKDEKAGFLKIRLLFVRALCEGDKPQVGKKDWAL